MSNRSYLSIGDVLTLLRQEFPDVTISKIRFLESQGLVNPERTPSGYRKFYDADVERLRWVLRQQREHFLPLKVIKDRLDDDSAGTEPVGEGAVNGVGSTGDAAAGETTGETEAAERAARLAAADGAATESAATEALSGPGRPGEAEHRVEESVLVGQRAIAASRAAEVASGTTGDQAWPRAADGSLLPGIETAPSVGADRAPAAASGSSVSSPNAAAAGTMSAVPASRRAPAKRPAVPASTDRPTGSAGAQTTAAEQHSGPTGESLAGSGRRVKAAGGDHEVAARPDPAPERSAPVPAPPAPPEPVAAPPVAMAPKASASTSVGTGVSMSVDELSAACGLDVGVLVELQEYGLLSPITVAGLDYFDEQGLIVATAAARFAQFGIEPRHLRIYKNAADREAGFVEQIVLPLVRQRNPEARARAHDTVDELAVLGQQLRGALLRGALRDLLNG
jgi:DNA-binding transcriptional MerR regulator